jgi:hypothetical protein
MIRFWFAKCNIASRLAMAGFNFHKLDAIAAFESKPLPHRDQLGR